MKGWFKKNSLMIQKYTLVVQKVNFRSTKNLNYQFKISNWVVQKYIIGSSNIFLSTSNKYLPSSKYPIG